MKSFPLHRRVEQAWACQTHSAIPCSAAAGKGRDSHRPAFARGRHATAKRVPRLQPAGSAQANATLGLPRRRRATVRR